MKIDMFEELNNFCQKRKKDAENLCSTRWMVIDTRAQVYGAMMFLFNYDMLEDDGNITTWWDSEWSDFERIADEKEEN